MGEPSGRPLRKATRKGVIDAAGTKVTYVPLCALRHIHRHAARARRVRPSNRSLRGEGSSRGLMTADRPAIDQNASSPIRTALSR
jgi:hypothetical protein